MIAILIALWLSNIFIAMLWLLLWVSVRQELAALKLQVADMKSGTEDDLPFAEETES